MIYTNKKNENGKLEIRQPVFSIVHVLAAQGP